MKKNKGFIAIIIILVIIIMGLVGYIVYDKLLSNNENQDISDNNKVINYQDYLGKWYESENSINNSNTNTLYVKNINDNVMIMNLYITRIAQFNDFQITFNQNKGSFEATTENGPAKDNNKKTKITGTIIINDNEIKVSILESNVLYLENGTEFVFTYKKTLQQPSNEIKYSKVIEQYKEAIEDTNIKEDYNLVEEKYSFVNEPFMYYYHMYGGGKFNYTYYDIDNNGIDELLVSYNGIKSIYTYDGNNPIEVIEIGDRAELEIYNNGVIYHRSSTGAATGYMEFYKIVGNDKELLEDYDYLFENEELSIYDDIDYKNKLEYKSIEEVEQDNLSKVDLMELTMFKWYEIN